MRSVLISLFFIFLTPSLSFSLSQGPLFASTMVNDNNGHTDWLNPANAIIEDGVVASTGAGVTNFLKGTGYGFTIPITSQITGILLEVKKDSNTNQHNLDDIVKLYNASGSVVGTDHADIVDEWVQGTLTWSSYGGSTDLWGVAWLPSDINSANFGSAFSATKNAGGIQVGNVDATRITVYYTNNTQIINGVINNGTLR